MSILVDENTRLLVQGITGREGTFHALRCMEYGTNLVAGVTPGRGGTTWEEKVPVFNSISEAVAETGANVGLISCPLPSQWTPFLSPPMPVCLLSLASRKASP